MIIELIYAHVKFSIYKLYSFCGMEAVIHGGAMLGITTKCPNSTREVCELLVCGLATMGFGICQLGYIFGIPGVTHYDIVSHDLIVEICMLHQCI